jgi:tetratricopeptide (TPR) repeat protein
MFHVKRQGRSGAPLLALPLALLFAAPPARAQDAGAEATRTAVRVARNRYCEGAYDRAAEAARAALDDAPDSLDALEVLSRSLAATGEEAAAERELAAYREKSPGKGAPALVLADLVLARDPHAAADLYREAAKDDAVRLRARIGLAAALAAEGARGDEEKELRQAFDAYRRTDDGTLGAGDFCALARAALLAERVPALQKEHARPFAKDARDFFESAWKKAREANEAGADPDILIDWARIYLEKWDLPEARRLLKEALHRAPRLAAAHALEAEAMLSDFFGGTEKYDEAREALDTALAINPRYAPAWTLKAELFVTDGLYDEAVEALEKALAARPLDLRAAADKAGVLTLREEQAKAQAVAAEVTARGKPQAAEFYTRLAALLDSKFRYRDAHRVAREAIERDPDYSPAYAQLGLAAMRAGDEDEAREFLTKAADADPFDLFTSNLLTLLKYLGSEFETTKTDHFILRLHKSEAAVLKPYVLALLERCREDLSKRYEVSFDWPVLVEVFPDLQDFSVRAVAHRFIPASGVTFARVVAIASPHALPPGTHAWARVLWHEMAHVATLERSQYRVPRWLTEGISVFEEQKGDPAWTREWDEMLVDALARGRLLPIRELNQGFSKPRFPNQVMLSYYQGGLICQFIEKTWGFPAILKLLDGYRAGAPIAENLAAALDGIAPEEFDRRFLAFARETFKDVQFRARCHGEEQLADLRREARAHPADKDVTARYALGAADMQRFADAEAAAVKLEKLDPGNGDSKLVLALVAAHRGDKPRAVELAAAALAAGTRDPLEANLFRAEYFAAQDPKTKQPRDIRQAIAALEAAHALFPRMAWPIDTLVGLYEEASDDAKRAAMLEVQAVTEPNNAAARIALARRAFEARDAAALARWNRETIAIDPQSAMLHALLAAECALDLKLEFGEEELAIAKSLAATPREAAALAPLLEEVRVALKNARAVPASPPPAAPEGELR